MSNKAFLAVHGCIYFAFALALFFLPALIWPLYGLEINDRYAYFLSQHTSIFLVGLSLVSLFFRDIKSVEAIRQILKALLATNIVGVGITTYAGITGVFSGFGWSDPIFFLLLTILSYFQLRKNYSNWGE